MSTGKKILLYLFSVVLVSSVFFIEYAFWPPANTDTVARISHDLACPCECPMVLEDCHMSCGLEWKDMVGMKLKAGLTREDINSYFFKRYGEAAMLTPIQRLNGKWYQLTRKGFPIKDGSLLIGMILIWAGIVYLVITAIIKMKRKGTASSIIIILFAGALSGTAWAENNREMILIPEGKFIMGSSSEEIKELVRRYGGKEEWFADEVPRKNIFLKSFYIDKFEVTNEDFSVFRTEYTYSADRKKHPVVNITWQVAADYCKWAGKRLPTEEEWEKAARGTEANIYPWGNKHDISKANTAESGRGGQARVGSYELESSGALFPGGTTDVGQYPEGASPYGVQDMAGNVWEWTSTWYDKEKGLMILKGGSWISPLASSRAALRLVDEATVVSNDYGFRCAKDVEISDDPS